MHPRTSYKSLLLIEQTPTQRIFFAQRQKQPLVHYRVQLATANGLWTGSHENPSKRGGGDPDHPNFFCTLSCGYGSLQLVAHITRGRPSITRLTHSSRKAKIRLEPKFFVLASYLVVRRIRCRPTPALIQYHIPQNYYLREQPQTRFSDSAAWGPPFRATLAYGDKSELLTTLPNSFASELLRLHTRWVWARPEQSHAEISSPNDARGGLFVLGQLAISSAKFPGGEAFIFFGAQGTLLGESSTKLWVTAST